MRRLWLKLSLAVFAVFLAFLFVFIQWDVRSQQELIAEKALAEARSLKSEMLAVWTYIDDKQDRINNTASGVYEFKGIFCASAGKAITERFTDGIEGYEVTYARENPRNAADEPDEFERAALTAFRESGYRENEYWQLFMPLEGESYFRYTSGIFLSRGCLDCHGQPAGEVDEVGYAKEGLAEGELAGLITIRIPTDEYRASGMERVTENVVLLAVLLLLTVGCIGLALRFLILRPLGDDNARLRRQNEEKSQYLAMLGHELRTPLSAILTFADLWGNRRSDQSPEDQALVRGVEENARSLLGIVNNSIDAAKLDANSYPLSLQEFDPVDSIGSVMTAAAPQAQRCDITLEKHIDESTPIMYSDAQMLYKIASNLVSNALTHAGDGCHVDIRMRGEGDDLVLEVADDGIGIPEADQAEVFECYAQGKSERMASNPKGSGLGLYLVRAFARRLGGEVQLVSEEGGGCSFTVRIPARLEDRDEGEGAASGGECRSGD